jgi:hypothetical protein
MLPITRKKLLFIFSALSIVGLVLALAGGDRVGEEFDYARFFQIWAAFSIPVLVQGAYMVIFRK